MRGHASVPRHQQHGKAFAGNREPKLDGIRQFRPEGALIARRAHASSSVPDGQEDGMLSREEIKEFFGFLDTASDAQLADRRKHLEIMASVYPCDSDARRDARYYIRRIAEEQAVRVNVKSVSAAYAARRARR